jgi:hypothetical protein
MEKTLSGPETRPCTVFEGHRLFISASLTAAALAIKAELDSGSVETFLVFEDATGKIIDLDLRGSDADVLERLSSPPQTFVGRFRPATGAVSGIEPATASEPRGRGRPKLGVVPREVTLLPRQWEWLSAQPGGASAVLRRLVDEAKRTAVAKRRAGQDASYQFMTAMAGDLPGYEEALRALFAGDLTALAQKTETWPPDIQAYVLRLATG